MGSPDARRRLLILGGTGFIGSALAGHPAVRGAYTRVEALGSRDLDLAGDASALAGRLGPDCDLVVCSAVKRQRGDNLENFTRNMAMATTLTQALAAAEVGTVAYFSSTAVYGEDVTGIGLDEARPPTPTSYYGMAKVAAEFLLGRWRAARPGGRLLVLRPPLVYGPGEAEPGYGPGGFLRELAAGRTQRIWGDGSELREFLYVGDLARLTAGLLASPHEGTFNLVAGRRQDFRGAFDLAAALTGRPPEADHRPRSRDKADHSFDAARLRAALPGFAFTSLEDGMRETLAWLSSQGTRQGTVP